MLGDCFRIDYSLIQDSCDMFWLQCSFWPLFLMKICRNGSSALTAAVEALQFITQCFKINQQEL